MDKLTWPWYRMIWRQCNELGSIGWALLATVVTYSLWVPILAFPICWGAEISQKWSGLLAFGLLACVVPTWPAVERSFKRFLNHVVVEDRRAALDRDWVERERDWENVN